MKRKSIGVLAVLLAASAIVVYKQTRGAAGPTNPAPAGSADRPQVVAFIDPGEADEVGGCGDIIRLMRLARNQGIGIQEIPPRSDPRAEKQFGVTVIPTVVFLDQSGGIARRHEGESAETIAAIRADLGRLGKDRR